MAMAAQISEPRDGGHAQQDLMNQAQQAMQAAQQLEARIQIVSQQLQLVEQIHSDHKAAHETLTSLLSASEGDEVLLPVGADTFVQMKVASKDKVIQGVGGGYATEKPLAKAHEHAKAEFDRVTKDRAQLQDTLRLLEADYERVQAVLQASMGGSA